jgi:SAM-dependent methyltransferase
MLNSHLRVLHEANRASWNAATIAHNSHKGDQIRFFRNGGDTLFPEEVELLGDVRGKRVLHLQCNCGQDSLSLAGRGADVTGVDISDQAIDFARNLSLRARVAVEFHRADLYDWLPERQRSADAFDIVFSSYGALSYLSSVEHWARLTAGVLRPGGRLVVVDFHPLLHMFDRTGDLQHPYSAPGEPRTCELGVSDYVGDSGPELLAGEFHEGIRKFENPYPHHTFHWGLGEISDALLAAGYRIDALREYPFANGQRHFDDNRVADPRRTLPPSHLPQLPMMFGVRAGR